MWYFISFLKIIMYKVNNKGNELDVYVKWMAMYWNYNIITSLSHTVRKSLKTSKPINSVV